jgi:hypothetical protein
VRRKIHAVSLVAAVTTFALMLVPAAGQRGGGQKSKAAVKAGPFTRLSDGKPNFEGYWQTRNFFSAFDLEEHPVATFEIPAGKGVVVDPADGKLPYQPWALAKKKDLLENHPHEDPQAHCMLSGTPRQIYTPFGFQIMQPKGHVVLLFEAFHAYRIIPTDGRPHPPQTMKFFEGHSSGKWEGDTLVVDVANQNDRTWFDMSGNFHSDAIHVVERYTPVDANTIRYEATIEDPNVFTRPFKIAFDLGRNTDPAYERMEYACVEGERDVEHIESGTKKK